MEYLCQDF